MAAPLGSVAARFKTFANISCFMVGNRQICTGYVLRGLSGNKIASKIQRKASKYMEKKSIGKTEKKKWYSNPGLFNPGSSHVFKTKGVKLGLQKRIKQVSILMHSNISQLVNTGEIGQELVDMGVEISKVSIPADFSAINVHWLATGVLETDEKIQRLMEEGKFRLRHELTALRVIGMVPRINFVKDTSEARYNEINELLKKADMGPEYNEQQVEYDETQTDNYEITETSADTSAAVNQSAAREQFQNISETTLNFKSDILDLDHESLVKQVLLRKSKKENRLTIDEEPSEKLEQTNDNIDFANFLLKKQKAANQLKKKSKVQWNEFADFDTLSELKDRGGRSDTTELQEEMENDEYNHDKH